VALLTLGLLVITFRLEKRRWVRLFSLLAFVSVILQALLGGLTVIYLLPTAISVMHACLGQTFLCLIVCIALFSSKEWQNRNLRSSTQAASLKRLSIITTGFIFVQLIAGAFIRHTQGQGVPLHIILGFIILMHILFILLRIAREASLREMLMSHGAFMGMLVLTQIFLGFGAFITTIMMPDTEVPRTIEVLIATAHQATGALILAASLLLTLRIGRNYQTSEETEPAGLPAGEVS